MFIIISWPLTYFITCECECVCVCVCVSLLSWALRMGVHMCVYDCASLHTVTAIVPVCVYVCVCVGTLSINRAGGLRDERPGPLVSQHAPLLSCLLLSRIGAWGAVKNRTHTAFSVC